MAWFNRSDNTPQGTDAGIKNGTVTRNDGRVEVYQGGKLRATSNKALTSDEAERFAAGFLGGREPRR